MSTGAILAKPAKLWSGRAFTATAPGPKNIKGRIMYNRDWDYETGPAAATTVKMYLPHAEIEFHGAVTKGGEVQKRGSAFSDDDGNFEFKNITAYRDAFLKVLLAYEGGKIVKIVGYENASATDAYYVQKDQVASGKMGLDEAKITAPGETVDLADIAIADVDFKAVCDVYHSIVFGHRQLKKKADYDTPLAEVRFPFPPSQGVSCASGGKLFIARDDAQDRSVLLHEWGHFLIEALIGSYTADASWPGGALYDYQTAGTALAKNSHAPRSKEYLESAWNEGVATFFSCALSESVVYHDDYDTKLTMDLEKDKVAVGAHCEGSIQGALWHFLASAGVDFKADFWTVLTDTSKRKVRTIWSFFDGYKDSGGAKLTELKAALKLHGMEYRYDYLEGGDRYKNIASPGTLDKTRKEFRAVAELYEAFGKTGGGADGDYKEEFYNKNRKFNSGQLDTGSTYADPKVKVGNQYIVPVRSEAK